MKIVMLNLILLVRGAKCGDHIWRGMLVNNLLLVRVFRYSSFWKALFMNPCLGCRYVVAGICIVARGRCSFVFLAHTGLSLMIYVCSALLR